MSHRDMYAVMVMDGMVLEYPPELYQDRARARSEAERWAWILAGTGWLEIGRPFEGRWTVGDRDVRLVPVTMRDARGPFWIAQYWTKHGYPDPEALVLNGRDGALSWVREPPPGYGQPVGATELPWFVAATYSVGDEEEYAVASLAKVIIES